MAMVSTDIWANELAVKLPGATKATIQQELRATFREICVRAGAWVRELPMIDMVEGVATYDLGEVVTDAEILYVLALRFRAESTPEDYFRTLTPMQVPHNRTRRVAVSDGPTAFYGDTEYPGRVTIEPIPSKTQLQSLLAYVSLGPMFPYEDAVPNFFRSHLFDLMLDGTAGHMMGQQDKPYTNMGNAQYYLRRFQSGLAATRDMTRRQFTTAESGFRFPAWAR